jgi:hypothetical protein
MRVGNYALYTCTVIYTVYSLPFVESTAVQMYMTVYVEISLVNGVVLEFTTVLLLYFLSVGFMWGRYLYCTKISDPPPPSFSTSPLSPVINDRSLTELNICNWHENIQSFGWHRQQWNFQNNENTMVHSE